MTPLEWMRLVRDDRALKPTTKAVAWAVATYANYRTCMCWPRIDQLMDATGRGESTIQDHLKVLRDRRYLTMTERYENGRQRSNLIALLEPVEGSGQPDPSEGSRGPASRTPRVRAAGPLGAHEGSGQPDPEGFRAKSSAEQTALDAIVHDLARATQLPETGTSKLLDELGIRRSNRSKSNGQGHKP